MSIQLTDLLQNLYGVKSTYRINKTTGLVQDTVTKIMTANPNRLSFLLVNTSASGIYVSPENDVSSTKGVYLAPLGGSMIMQWDRDFELVASEWFAIATSADSAIYVLENISV